MNEQQLAQMSAPRLAYHPRIGEVFGVDRAQWKALCEAIYPSAKTTEGVVMALAYCKARNLDVMKRPCHVVAIYDKDKKRYVDTIWPGIAELRMTAFRTGQYAGKAPTQFGPMVEEQIGRLKIRYPEWAQVTVQRLVGGQIIPFCGPTVYWKETYASCKRDDPTPNDMWAKRPSGQLEKCAEAAALRMAFPEEMNTDFAAEEVNERRVISPEAIKAARPDMGLGPEAEAEIVDNHLPTDVDWEAVQAEREEAREMIGACESLADVNAAGIELGARHDDPDWDAFVATECEAARQRIRAGRGERANGE